MNFLELTRLTNEDFNMDDEMKEHEDDKEFYYVPPSNNSFPSLHATLPAHTFYCEDSHSVVETLQWMPTESSLRMDSSPDNSEISLPMPGLSNRDMLPLSFSQPEQRCATPRLSNREVFSSLHYGPPPRFDSQPKFPSLLYPSPPIFNGQPEQYFVTSGPSNREVVFPSLCYAPPQGLRTSLSSVQLLGRPIHLLLSTMCPLQYLTHPSILNITSHPTSLPYNHSLSLSYLPLFRNWSGPQHQFSRIYRKCRGAMRSVIEFGTHTTHALIFWEFVEFLSMKRPIQWRAAKGSLFQQVLLE
jgi:hypothetical protein